MQRLGLLFSEVGLERLSKAHCDIASMMHEPIHKMEVINDATMPAMLHAF